MTRSGSARDLPRLAAASTGMMLAPLASAVTGALRLGVEVDSYLARAAAVGVSRERAMDVLREAQGAAAGSTPTAADFRNALERLYTAGAYSDAPRWCPCGHWTGGDYQCLNGRIYGPRGHDNCTGVCDDTHGRCSADGCLCEEDV